ncbi:GNAT family N-acetyltransferase [Mycolicibacterium sp. P1-18]|uniref:GNAT family N-acetyltransferase n=1 Tax=Mycolicibacterium sp. P1-18 TaxID=2024615 RepID=UPI0018D7154B|nr:GNAT family N-acetyltransferase [Mycolicibacterium sp. P1-18]
MPTELVFRPVPSDAGDAATLVAAMLAEMRELYWDVGGSGGLDLDSPDMPKAGPAELGPPGGVFLVGYRDGVAVCGGGLKRLPDGGCEIKRMYVVPEARGQGLAPKLLHALEDAARGLGYAVARLDTGPRQTHAQRLYEREGYRAVDNFNANPVATYFGEKWL